MKLTLEPHHEQFREQIRTFIRSHCPRPVDEEDEAALQRWQQALVAAGWQAYRWDKHYGGTDWDATQKYLWELETAAWGLPPQAAGAGISMLGPILYGFGSEEQQQRFLPGILDTSQQWCQGYSEPGAGSDLASLATRATRQGDHYLVNGQKIWTSGAHKCQWMFCLVRTSTEGRKQQGISFLLIDMQSPGIEVAPIISLDGYHSLNSVVLTDVQVPIANRIGAENKGWTYAKGLLTHERTGLAFISKSRQKLAVLQQQAKANGLAAQPEFAAKIAAIATQLEALAITELRVLDQVKQGQAPGIESSLLKLKGTQIIQRVTELLLECTGYAGMPYPLGDDLRPARDRPAPSYAQPEIALYLIGRSASIAGGSDEVQYNIIAKHVLGL